MLPDNVRVAIVVEVSHAGHAPDWRDGSAALKHLLAKEVSALHRPKQKVTVPVTEQKIRVRIAIEVTETDELPEAARAGMDEFAALELKAVHKPNIQRARAALPQNIFMAIEVEVVGADNARARHAPRQAHRANAVHAVHQP